MFELHVYPEDHAGFGPAAIHLAACERKAAIGRAVRMAARKGANVDVRDPSKTSEEDNYVGTAIPADKRIWPQGARWTASELRGG